MSQTVDLGYVRGTTGEKGDTGPNIERDVLNNPLVSDLGTEATCDS